jgi:hypothetical protein
MLTPLAYLNARLRNAFYRRKKGFLFFSLGLVIAAGILIWPAGQRSQARGSPHMVSADRFVSPDASQQMFERTASAPSPTPTFPPLQTPTSLPVPKTGLVWSRNANGVYLWKSPQGKILTRLPNGTSVGILEARSSYGSLPWVKVHSPSGVGWILLTQVFRRDERPVAYITIKEGTFLRDRPRGGVEQALSMGTPIMNILGTHEAEGRIWVQVAVLDGAVGWVAQEWLSAERPVGENDD